MFKPKAMVTVNVDIKDMLLHGQVGELAGFEIRDSIVRKVYLKFQGPLVERNAVLSDHFAQQTIFYHYENVMQIYQSVSILK